MTDTTDDTTLADGTREFRLGDRVLRRVGATQHGDIVGVNLTINSEPSEKICVGWADGSRTWELPIELRLEAEL